MGTVTLSGFNNIDFSQILEAVMQVERQPVALLQQEQKALEAQKTAFATFASKLGALQSAAEALAASTAFDGTTTTVSDPTRSKSTSTRWRARRSRRRRRLTRTATRRSWPTAARSPSAV
jgi:flagellar hook-associated protein 2